MTDFIPTPEQEAVVDAGQNKTKNLAVIARAGAAKTSTLILLANALTEKRILALAFNRKIADEMAERLPDNCESTTLHSLGYSTWRSFIRKQTRIDDRKIYKLLRNEIDQLHPDDRSEAFDSMSETMDMIKTGKGSGWLPEKMKGTWRPLITDAEFFGGLPMEPSPLQEDLIKAVSEASFKQALEGILDFDDMIFCPAISPVSWPSFPLTLIDEAQDLSPLNHHCLKKLVRNNRLIAVGDPFQAIYGFRGASEKSMQQLVEKFQMEELYLTISFRCARKITENVHWRAPDMKWPDWAKEGEVHRKEIWSTDEIQDGDAIICRNNAPLFSMAISLIEAGRLPDLAGRDVGKMLLKIMKKLGQAFLPKLAALDALEHWKSQQVARAREGAVAQIEDQYLCIKLMLDRTKTLGDAIAYLEHLLNRDGRIHLMTGHKSKGLEFDRVWFLDQQLCRIDRGQDANIKYVIETRAKEWLSYVDSSALEIETPAD